MVDEAGNAKQTQALLGMNVIKNFHISMSFNANFDVYGKKLNDGIIKMRPMFYMDEIPTLESFIPNDSRFGLWSITQQNELSQFTQRIDWWDEFLCLSENELNVLRFASLSGSMIYVSMVDQFLTTINITEELCQALVRKGF